MSKKVRKIKRRAVSEATRKSFYVNKASRWLTELETDTIDGQPICYEDAHQIAYNLLDSIEKKMLTLGYRPSELPTYKRRLGGQTRADAGNFTLCKRCEYCEAQADGTHVCTVFCFKIDPSAPYEVAEGDGCARGLPREEYR